MRDVCKLFQSFKNSLEDARVKKFASKGANFLCLGLKLKDFLLQGGGDGDTQKHMAGARGSYSFPDDLGERLTRGRAARVTCEVAVGLGGEELGEGWPAGEGQAPLQAKSSKRWSW